MHLPDDSASADVFALVLAVQHRSTGHHDSGDVAAGGPHQQGRGGFVAAGQQHNAVNRVAANGFFHVHAGQIAGQHGGRAQVRFAVGEHRKFNREAACFDDAALDVLSNGTEMGVARRQFGPSVADTNDRFALKLMVGNALILHPAAVHEAVFVRAAKPLGGAQGRRFIRHVGLSYCMTNWFLCS